MFSQCHVPVLLTVLSLLAAVRCVTVYGAIGAIEPTTATPTSTTPGTAFTGNAAAAYNQVVLQPPPVPQPPPPTQFTVQLQDSSQGVQNLSIQHGGDFFGFSIEMSVVDRIVGINSTFINPIFLNYMALIQRRGGRVNVRVGGNSQDTATVVDSLPNGQATLKGEADTTNSTATPALLITPELIYMLSNVSALVGARWYLGVPLNDTTNLRLQIAELGETILGTNLIGLQIGNEPDLYAEHGHRPPGYNAQGYANDFGVVAQALAQDPKIQTRNNMIGPSVSSGPWKPEDVWNTGFITTFQSVLGALSVQHYADNNCATTFPNGGFGPPRDPQVVFPDYLNHTSGVSLVAKYLNSTALAQQAGIPFLMFETNSASCGGYPGISDSFGAALWALDYGYQMAYGNFSGANLHVGGQSDTYNPFTPPPTNESLIHQWTTGPVFYSAMVLAETFGTSGQAQIVDIQANGGNIYTPGYAIYDGGALSKAALFNYVSDPSGASDYTAIITTATGTTPAQVYVKYLLAPSVAEKRNITWAGQTLGVQFESDGRLQGTEAVQVVPCSQGRFSSCSVKVPAPGMALVFFSDTSLSQSEPQNALTFATTAMTRTVATAIVNPSELATAQGQSGRDRERVGSTSKGSSSGASRSRTLPLSRTLLIGTALLAFCSTWTL